MCFILCGFHHSIKRKKKKHGQRIHQDKVPSEQRCEFERLVDTQARLWVGQSDDVVLLAIVRTLAVSVFWADLSWTTFLKLHSFTAWGSTIRNQGWKWGDHQGIRQERQRLSLRWEQRRWWEKLDFRPYSVFGRWGWMDFLSDRLIGCEMWQEAKIQGSLWGLGPEQLLRMGSPQLSRRRLGVRDAVRCDEGQESTLLVV